MVEYMRLEETRYEWFLRARMMGRVTVVLCIAPTPPAYPGILQKLTAEYLLSKQDSPHAVMAQDRPVEKSYQSQLTSRDCYLVH